MTLAHDDNILPQDNDIHEHLQSMQHMCNFDFMSVAIFKSFFALHTIFSLCCDTECLLQHCKEGDGYQQKSPHTYSEYFEGLNILDAAQVHNYVRKTKHTYAATYY